jgi:hypothetical protein
VQNLPPPRPAQFSLLELPPAANVSPEAELAYSQEKIQENFSNYSAFHHRSNFMKTNATSLMTVLPPEFSIVKKPDDQSAWWYHQFLLTWALTEVKAKHVNGATEETVALASWLVGICSSSWSSCVACTSSDRCVRG